MCCCADKSTRLWDGGRKFPPDRHNFVELSTNATSIRWPTFGRHSLIKVNKYFSAIGNFGLDHLVRRVCAKPGATNSPCASTVSGTFLGACVCAPVCESHCGRHKIKQRRHRHAAQDTRRQKKEQKEAQKKKMCAIERRSERHSKNIIYAFVQCVQRALNGA